MIAIALLVLVAVFAALITARVAILRAALDAGLTAAGLPDVRYRIASVGFGSTRIAVVALGREIAVADVTLQYHPLRLLGLHIDAVTVAGLRLDLTQGAGALAGLAQGGEGEGTSAAFDGSRLPRLRLADGLVQLPGGGVVALSEVSLTPLDKALILTGESLALTYAGQHLVVAGLNAQIDWPGAADSPPGAAFTVASLRHDGDNPLIAPLALTGAVRPDGETWHLTATASGPAPVRFDLAASYDTARGVAEGRVTLPEIRFTAGGLQPADVAPALAAVTEARGTVGGHLAFRRQAGHLTVEGAWRADRLGFLVNGLPVEALTARLALSGTDDPTQAAIRIEEARMTLAGGTVAIDKATVRPLADSNRLVLGLTGIDLKESLAALGVAGVSGEGRIDGRLPLVVSGGAVAVEAARFDSRGPGVLRIRSEDAAAALAQGGEDANLLLRALEDFRFENLSLSVDKPLKGDSRLALATLGHNPAVLDGHPFQINVTLETNLDKLLSVFADGSRLSQAAIRAIVGARRTAPQGDNR